MRIRELVFVALGVTIVQAAFAFLMSFNPSTKAFWEAIRG